MYILLITCYWHKISARGGADSDIKMGGMCQSTDLNETQKYRFMTEKVNPKIWKNKL